MSDITGIIKALEQCRQCECDFCTEEHASQCPWDCIAYDELVGKAVKAIKELIELLHKKQKDIDRLCVEISELKHKLHGEKKPTLVWPVAPNRSNADYQEQVDWDYKAHENPF